jgi:O-antigen/teichoic acid export membrane protein
MTEFKKQFLSGVLWTSIEMLINRGFKFVIKLILARVLFPEDYGIVGMAVVFTSIIGVFNEMGIGAALIQKKEKSINHDDFNTAFWSGLVWSFFIYALMVFIVGPLAANFYNEPILQNIIPVLSIGVLAAPIISIHNVILVRKLNFKKISFISNTGAIFSGSLSLILALNGAGVWSLVFDSVAGLVIVMPQYMYATKWFPKYRFSKKSFKDIFGFGVFTTGTKLLGTVNNQIDYLVVGKLLGATALGLYSFAFLITSIARSQIIQLIEKVVYPLFSKYQESPKDLNAYYLKVMKAIIYIIFPIMFAVMLFSEYFVSILFGNKWNDAIPIINYLSIGVIVSTIVSSSGVLIRSSGKPKLELKLATVSSLCFFLPSIFIGTYYYGVEGAAIGYIVAMVAKTILIIYLLKRLFKIEYQELYNNIKTPIFVSLIPFLIIYFIKYYNFYWMLYVVIYFLILITMILVFSKKDVTNLKSTLKGIKRNNPNL